VGDNSMKSTHNKAIQAVGRLRRPPLIASVRVT
jgi:hypothetical protein